MKIQLMLKKIGLTLAYFLLFSAPLSAQQSIGQMVPMSPNAAAITKYGETPVSHFTGVPNIAIPIYEIETSNFKLPISLSYHAGGNTVGNIPSWTGMGWSLGTIPIITRSVKGLPDEEGFFYKFAGKTVKQIYNSGTSSLDYKQFLQSLALGEADSEPDVFYYSLNGKNGKFIYDQESETFRLLNKDNIQIARSTGNSFVITNDNGDRYYFTAQELTTSNQKSVATAWNVTKMVNAQGTDSLMFSYQQYTTTAATYRPNYKYVVIGGTQGSTDCEIPANNESIAVSVSTTVNNMIDRITFKGGYVKFTVQQQEREDLLGGRALDIIRVYTHQDILVKDYKLNYSYLSAGTQGGGCVINDIYRNNKWLILTGISENAKNGSFQHIHTFNYDDTYIPPCRNSAAQDLWGYFNGASSNNNLIPSFSVPTSTSVMEVPGADRTVNPIYSHFGILKRITYPTGGHTDFEFENNVAAFGIGTNNYLSKTAVLLGESVPSSNIYTKTFTIDNAADPFLNANMGGAFISGRFGDLGCELNNMANTCAELYLEGISEDVLGYFLNVTSAFSGLLIPNGTYKMTAKFNQAPVQYQNFWYELSWKEKDTNFGNNTYVGGLRVKRTAARSTATAAPIVKSYRYTTTYDSNISSGDVFADVGRDYKYVLQGVGFKRDLNGTWSVNCVPLLKVVSAPQNPEVSHSGSYIGYRNVHLFTDSLQLSGLSSYSYSHVMDIQYRDYPFPPITSQEAFRGQLLTEINYKWSDGVYIPVKKASYTYQNETELSTSFALGTDAFHEVINNGAFSDLPNFVRIPIVAPYQLYTTWSNLASKQERIYDIDNPNSFIETSTSYEYDPLTSFLKKTEMTTSQGEVISTNNYYPKDLSLSGDAEVGRQWLVDHNVLAPILKQQTQHVGELSEVLTDYKAFGAINQVWPAKVTKKHNGTVAEQADYHAYSPSGRPLELSRNGGAKISYQWDNIEQYPVVEAQNAAKSEIFYEGFEGSNGFTGNAYVGLKRSGSSYTVNWTPPNNKAYLIAYWKNTGNVWSYVQTTYPASNNYQLNGGDYYDEVKIFPADAQLSTFAYEPLVGMISRTDPRGAATSYTYDGFNRLENIKDHNGNIVKNYSYHIIGNNALWNDTQLMRCHTDGQGRYTWQQEKQQRDGNPTSSTYNQTRWVPAGLSTACARNIYARVEIEHTITSSFPTSFDPLMMVTLTSGDVYIRLYDDAACTIPATYGTDLQLSVQSTYDWLNGNDSGQTQFNTNYTMPFGSNSLFLYNTIFQNSGQVPDMMDPSQAVYVSNNYTFSVVAANGNLYTAKPSIFK
jgi:YD repeat-containing protein